MTLSIKVIRIFKLLMKRLFFYLAHKRQAALNEVQRLKREGTLVPVKAGSPEVEGSGLLTISAITVPLKQEYFRNMGISKCNVKFYITFFLYELYQNNLTNCYRYISSLRLLDVLFRRSGCYPTSNC